MKGENTDFRALLALGIALIAFEASAYAFDIDSSAGPDGSIDPAGRTHVSVGSDLPFAAIPQPGFLVDTWFVNDQPVQSGGGNYTLTNIRAYHRVHVTFTAGIYVINAMAGSGGSVSPAGVTEVRHGDDLEFTATPGIGRQINTWSVDGVHARTGGETFKLSNITANHVVEVEFVKIHYPVSASAGPGGSVNPANVTVAHGSKYTFNALADVGYQIDQWFVDGSVVQTGKTAYELGPVYDEHTLHVTFKPRLSHSLGTVDFDDQEDFEQSVVSNNTGQPDEAVVSVEAPGPDTDNLAMALRNRTNDQGETVNARAKGIFIMTGADEVLIRFRYLFMAAHFELAVYVSDSPLLLAHDDPTRGQHYLEVARLAAPPFDLPGSPGSGRFAVFQKRVWTGSLDFSQGLFIELELMGNNPGSLMSADLGPRRLTGVNGGNSVYVDDWSTRVQCYGICLDINWDNFVDEADFLTIISGHGLTANGDKVCLEGSFSTDGYMDSHDITSWDWALNSDQRLLNFCGLPLTGGSGGLQLGSVRPLMAQGPAEARPLAGFVDDLSDLLILGKRGPADAPSKLSGRLYAFTREGQFSASLEPARNRTNTKLIQGPDGEIYQLNSERGLLGSDSPHEALIPPASLELAASREPRYNTSATVHIGIQDLGADSFGRPVLDVAMDADYVYVVPVVVSPNEGQAYLAAAKLKLLPQANPPYELVKIYDDPPVLNDNQYRDNLREIELDAAGNVYVLNANALNESDILWRYKLDGTIDRLNLGRPGSDTYVPAPIALHVSKTSDMLYLASALLDPVDPESSTVYGFSTQGPLTLTQTIAIPGLQHVTSMTEDVQTGTLWVAGFYMNDPPLYPNPTQPAFYYAQVARISSDGSDVQLLPLFAPADHDLSLPISVLWTGSAE